MFLTLKVSGPFWFRYNMDVRNETLEEENWATENLIAFCFLMFIFKKVYSQKLWKKRCDSQGQDYLEKYLDGLDLAETAT